MKKSLTAKIFLLLALALCLVPSVGMLVHGPAEARANESAARAPELTGRGGALNADYLSELADYAGEGFYLRGELITLYARALARAAQMGKSYTDDCQLIEAAGGTVFLTPGDYRNIKITTPEDLLVAEAFAAAQDNAPG